MVSANLLAHYRRLRRSCLRAPRWPLEYDAGHAKRCLDDARTCARFDDLHDHIGLAFESDPDTTFEDWAGDMFNPVANPDISRTKLAIEEDRARSSWHGCISAVVFFCQDEEYISSIGGFLDEDDFMTSGYEVDLKQEAIDAYCKHLFGRTR